MAHYARFLELRAVASGRIGRTCRARRDGFLPATGRTRP